MKPQLTHQIGALASYPPDCQLTESEIEDMVELAKQGLRTINGDTAPVMITARQLLLLIGGYTKNIQ